MEALAIHRHTRDYALEALDLHYLGMSYRQLGEKDSGQTCLEEAMAIYGRLGMPQAEEVKGLVDADSG
jgi:hypothetical protein